MSEPEKKNESTELALLDNLPSLDDLSGMSTELFDPDADSEAADKAITEKRFFVFKVKNGTQHFQVIDLNGEEKLVKKFWGILVHFNNTKQFWKKTYGTGAATAPDCWSNDAEIPHPNCAEPQAKSCALCPHNKLVKREDGSKMKPCRDTLTMFIWKPDYELPILLRASTMNRNVVGQFIKACSDRPKPIAKETLICEFSLVETQNKAGTKYDALKIDVTKTILDLAKAMKKTPREVADAIAAFKVAHAESFESAAMEVDDDEKAEVATTGPKAQPKQEPKQEPKSTAKPTQAPAATQKTEQPTEEPEEEFDEVSPEGVEGDPPF